MQVLMSRLLSQALLGILFFLMANVIKAQTPIHLYIDADRTGARASGIAIEQGVRVALDEVDNQLAGRDVELIIRDHHGSSVRSKRHLDEFLKDDKALLVYSGLHSPPLLSNLGFINENKILLLDPWAAAGPITRYPKSENWIFRLSVDDSKAGTVIVGNALAEGLTKPYLLLEDTGWGKSNHKTMRQALEKQGLSPVGVQWFNWNLGDTRAKIMLRNIAASGADSILMVANASEGKTFANAMLALTAKERLPVRSHWGITGGDFAKVINAEQRRKLDLKFLQTRFSFVSSTPNELSENAFATAKKLFPDVIETYGDIEAPTGFIHAYDITRLLIEAVNNTQMSGDMQIDRERIRVALENIKQPVKGLIKTYHQPFTAFNTSHPDAHEALGIDDLVMAYYGEDNQIILDEK